VSHLYIFLFSSDGEFFSKPYQDRIARLSIFQFTSRVEGYVAPIIRSNRGYRFSATGLSQMELLDRRQSQIVCLRW